MSYNVLTIAYFDKQLKRLVKKYPSLKAEYAGLIKILKNEPQTGTPIGSDCYKIRLGIASKGKGRSGGARVIMYFAVTDSSIFLLSIYDKSEKEDIDDKELLRLLNIVK